MDNEASKNHLRREHGRPDLRLPFYDYTSLGPYYLSLCTEHRKFLFGEVVGSEMTLSEYGQIVHDEWLRSAELRQELMRDAFVVMPNHLHAIVGLAEPEDGAHCRVHLPDQRRSPRPPRGLASFIAGFKAYTTKLINAKRGTPQQKLWQANYYERIIRNERELSKFRLYIANNPAQWELDHDKIGL